MGVVARTAVSGEVLEAGDDALSLLLFDPYGGALRHAAWAGSEAAVELADDGAGGVDVDVDAGGEIEVDAEVVQRAGCQPCAAAHAVDSAFGACRRRGERREAVLRFEACDASSFLVDADEECFAAKSLKVSAKAFQLCWRADVAWTRMRGGVVFEEDDASDVVLADVADDVACVAECGSAEADKEHLGDVVAQALLVAVGAVVLGVAAGGQEQGEEDDGEERFHCGFFLTGIISNWAGINRNIFLNSN